MLARDALSAAVNGAWITDAAERLVQLPSVTLHEEAVCRLYNEQLRGLGLEVDVREVTPGRNNLYARISGVGGGPTLMLNGHLDTIPNPNQQPCYRDGDRLYGRGTTDMKGGMAAVLGVARAFAQSGVQLKGDLLLTAVVGHEQPEAEKDGPRALIDDMNSGPLACDRIVIVEGPDALWIMSMGSMVFTISLTSELGGRHTQYVPFEDNPLRYMGELLRRIHENQKELDGGATHPLAGPERIDLGIAAGGDYFNRTPTELRLTGTRRWMPGRTAPEVLEELRALAAPIAEAGHLGLRVEMAHNREPFETPQDDPAVQAATRAHREVTGEDVEYIGLRIVGDANLYVHGSGVPTFYYGPSNQTAHADVEWVSMSRMESAAKVYALLAADYCGVA